MKLALVLTPFVLAGIGVIFVAFRGGPAAARAAYLTGGGRFFRGTMLLLYLALGIGVPAAIIASRGEAEGGVGRLAQTSPTQREEHGKYLFKRTCASCHSLAAVNARGVTGPNLDQIGQVTPQRVQNAIRIGGTGQKRMPAHLLEGQEARDVAAYLSKVAGR
ncbi:MAG: cytochrome c [Thermoleophilaceae bacterium]